MKSYIILAIFGCLSTGSFAQMPANICNITSNDQNIQNYLQVITYTYANSQNPGPSMIFQMFPDFTQYYTSFQTMYGGQDPAVAKYIQVTKKNYTGTLDTIIKSINDNKAKLNTTINGLIKKVCGQTAAIIKGFNTINSTLMARPGCGSQDVTTLQTTYMMNCTMLISNVQQIFMGWNSFINQAFPSQIQQAVSTASYDMNNALNACQQTDAAFIGPVTGLFTGLVTLAQTTMGTEVTSVTNDAITSMNTMLTNANNMAKTMTCQG